MSSDHQTRANQELDHWHTTTMAALQAALDDLLDLDAGLADAQLSGVQHTLVHALDDVLDLDAGLSHILPTPPAIVHRTRTRIRLRANELVDELVEPIRQWLPGQRWFAAERRGADTITPRFAATIIDDDPGLVHAMVDVDGQTYQLLLGVRSERAEHGAHALIGQADRWRIYDATHDPELMGQVLDLLATDADRGGLRFRHEPWAELETGLPARTIDTEQSNTSVIYGQNYVLKLLRRPAPGPNRHVELHRALYTAGNTHTAEPLGTIAGDLPDGPTVLGSLQQFLPDAVEGWAMAAASIQDLLAEPDLHADEMGGDFAGEAFRLGAAVAEVHTDLAAALGNELVPVDVIGSQVDAMHAQLDAVLTEAPELREHEAMLREVFDAVRALRTPIEVQHVHGDLHLGQVLRSTAGWVLIDFEGEQDANPAHRTALHSPLRDVAGMLRSFEYAAMHLVADDEDDPRLLTRAAEWADRNKAAFCDGYATIATDPRSQPVLLRAFELDKAVNEIAHEPHDQPDRWAVPPATLRRGQTG